MDASYQKAKIDPESIIAIIACVTSGERKPSMGEKEYIHQTYDSYNDKLYRKLKSKNLFENISLFYHKFPKKEIDTQVSDLMIKETTKNKNSVCMQAITVHGFRTGYGPSIVRMITVFKTPSGKDPEMIFCEDPISIGRCFIITAAYGESNIVNEILFFRDQYLINNYFGRLFCEIYYILSPPIANIISKSNILKKIVRLILKPILVIVKTINKMN